MNQNLSLNNRNIKLPNAAAMVTIFYQLFVMITIVFHLGSISNPVYFFMYHSSIIVILLWLPYTEDRKLWRWLKTWNPVLIIPTNFAELHYLIHNVNPIDWDNAFIKLDYYLFRVHPTVWIEKWAHPLLTEYFQIIYTTFYFLPIVLATILYIRKEHDRFDYFVFVLVFGIYACYISYFLFPALGPRFTLDHLQDGPVSGIWISDLLRQTLDTLENIQRDAFPSGHTQITLLTMLYAWRYSKPYFWILVIIGTSLIFSTVYLRYHYVVDVIGGILLFALIEALSPWLYDKLNQLRTTFSNKSY
jgi:membrane-associated phospholipid phosphatase